MDAFFIFAPHCIDIMLTSYWRPNKVLTHSHWRLIAKLTAKIDVMEMLSCAIISNDQTSTIMFWHHISSSLTQYLCWWTSLITSRHVHYILLTQYWDWFTKFSVRVDATVSLMMCWEVVFLLRNFYWHYVNATVTSRHFYATLILIPYWHWHLTDTLCWHCIGALTHLINIHWFSLDATIVSYWNFISILIYLIDTILTV